MSAKFNSGNLCSEDQSNTGSVTLRKLLDLFDLVPPFEWERRIESIL